MLPPTKLEEHKNNKSGVLEWEQLTHISGENVNLKQPFQKEIDIFRNQWPQPPKKKKTYVLI